MTHKPVLVPSASHPITIQPNPARVVVTVGGTTVADTTRALTLREASYRAVEYIPRADVDMAVLEPSDHQTYCPFKGDCAYFSVVTGDGTVDNAVWTYEQPYPAVAPIKEYVAFYPNKVEITIG
jgi:uncharacterized protein (DUF427 family)